jgi:multiple sugar transport system ATP-binding protein
VRRAAEMLDIAGLLGRYPRQLSGGQRQRVAIGRAIVRNPRLFLFDEPLSNLDAKLRDEMRSEIKRLHRELGTTMIYVTHDQIEAMTLADRIVLLKDGLIEQAGAPLELFERPATRFVAGFLGSPSMNFLPARLTDGGAAPAVVLEDGSALPLPAHRRPADGAGGDRSIILGLRPEHMTRAGHGGARQGVVQRRVKIELVQPTGSRTYITFPMGGAPVMGEVQAHDAQAPGEEIDIGIDMNRAVLIDRQTDRVI